MAFLASAIPLITQYGPQVVDLISKYGPGVVKYGGKIANALFSKSGRRGIKSFFKDRTTAEGFNKLIKEEIPEFKNQFDKGVNNLQLESKKIGLVGADKALEMVKNNANNIYSAFSDKDINNLENQAVIKEINNID